MPPLHQFFLNRHYNGKGVLCFCFDFAEVFVQGATPTPKVFWNCHYCGKAALCFCFDLVKTFLQGAIMTPLNPFFLIFIIVGRGHYASASI
jgi:hypothetical protein